MTKNWTPAFAGVTAVLFTLITGCAAQRPPSSSPSDRQPAPSSGPFSTPEPAKPPPSSQKESVAVASIVQGARAEAAAGKLANAAASIERALRIEPRNPRLWNELARIRLQQHDWAQAESTAARSNSFAGGDQALRASNADIIAQARRGSGR